MKKRKELNALIGLGDSKRKKTKKGSGHRLLRTEPPGSESESSSEDDDFNNVNGGTNFGKRSYSQCCNVCYPLFLFIILAACVMACAGLIWMQIALKEDLDSLKEKLHSMESSQKVSSSEIPKINEDLKNKEKKFEDIENGDKGLSKLWSNLTEMNRKITSLDSAVNHLKTSLKSSADLIGLPTTVEELQKSVATIGSTLTSVQHDVETMKASLENQKKDDESKKTMDITDLKRAMGEVNKTEEQHHMWTDEQIHILLSTVADLHQRVASLENGSKPSLQYNDTVASLAVSSKKPETKTVTETTTLKETPQELEEMSTPLTVTQTSRRPRFLTPRRFRRNAGTKCPGRVLLPGINSLTDLEDIYQRARVRHDSLGLTYQELKLLFGTSTPSEHALACFDDGDRKYSLMELRAAVGL
ncbi:EF-hand calcium-binding domain-containing protein 14 [Poeciliopsis prolifica]|uniref:EF-hand calcium-binding domain-containing protein 14 n=1 Tax=Poeciliopsis prolifica TaxID=188132 RepID=UPI00072CCB50|nr:EF-hand calcium-binding domain-containing protein 14 [Poeciliopsis prolifica]